MLVLAQKLHAPAAPISFDWLRRIAASSAGAMAGDWLGGSSMNVTIIWNPPDADNGRGGGT